MYSNNKEEKGKSLWSRVIKQSLFYATFVYLTLTSNHKNYIMLLVFKMLQPAAKDKSPNKQTSLQT